MKTYGLSLLIYTFVISSSLTFACDDLNANACTKDVICEQRTVRPITPDGSTWGDEAIGISKSSLTQGCYCQIAYVETYGGYGTPVDKPYNNNTFATSCDPHDQYWWDGEAVMNTTGGSFYANDQYMKCSKDLGYFDFNVPTRIAKMWLIEWPTDSQNQLEESLPPNVAIYPTGTCPGSDFQDGFHPNVNTATALTSDNVQDCTCQTYTSVPISGTTASDDLNGNSAWTICSKDFKVYWNGVGYRNARGVGTSDDAVSLYDECTSKTSTAAVQLVYVVGSSSNDATTTLSMVNVLAIAILSLLLGLTNSLIQ